MTNFQLHDEQTVNGLAKIAWASVFCLKQQHIHIFIDIYLDIDIDIYIYIYGYIDIYIYICKYCHFNKYLNTRKTELTEKTSVCLLRMETENFRLFSANKL